MRNMDGNIHTEVPIQAHQNLPKDSNS